MARVRILALILAGGAGSRMELLTEVRAKPALPYAGVYRLIDFPLSNCVHSAITDVWVVEQFQPHSLNEHLVNGRPWDLDRTYGGLRLMPPYTGTREGGWHQGNADAIYHNRRFIRDFNPDVVLTLSADHIYKLNYRDAIEAHLDSRADVTIVTTQVPREQASRFGVVQLDGKRVTHFAYKPDKPASGTVTTEVFVYDARTLLDTLDELADESDETDESGLEDFGHQLLPRLVETGRAYAYPLDGYWRDVGTIESYFASHMDLLQDEPPLKLDEPDWPILTYGTMRLPARIHGSARIERGLIAPGCTIHGSVINAVLAPGVVVEPGATVRDAIIFGNTRIQAGAHVQRAIIDSDVTIGAGAQIGGERSDDESITLIAQGAQVAADAVIRAGDRVKSQDAPEG
jgi:glucose-1-phosphate adenylyltransferase